MMMIITVLMKIVLSIDNPSSKLCVYGSSMRDTTTNNYYTDYVGIQGEYTLEDSLDSNGNEYWNLVSSITFETFVEIL